MLKFQECVLKFNKMLQEIIASLPDIACDGVKIIIWVLRLSFVRDLGYASSIKETGVLTDCFCCYFPKCKKNQVAHKKLGKSYLLVMHKLHKVLCVGG